MIRKLELPEEFFFDNGTKVRNPIIMFVII